MATVPGEGTAAPQPHRGRNAFICLTLALFTLAGCTQQSEPTNATAAGSERATNGAPEDPPQPRTPKAELESPSEVITLTEPPEITPADVWPMFRGNPQGTAVTAGTLPAELELLWKVRVEGGGFESTAAIDDDTVYVGSLEIGGYVYAYDLATGEQRWKFPTDLGFRASPNVRDGVVYIGDEDGRFFAIDAASGKMIWVVETGAEIDSCANFYGENIVVGSQDATLYCLEAASGKIIWKFQIEDQIRCMPTIVEDRAFIAGCDGRLHIIDLDDGQLIAQVEIDSPTGSTPAVLDSYLYFGTEGGDFFCINWRKPGVVWRRFDRAHSYAIRSSAAVTTEAVFVGSRDKQLHAYHPTSGQVVWNFPTRARIDSSPVVAGERVYVATGDGRIVGLDVKSGKPQWQYDAGGGFTASPAIAQGHLAIGSDDGVFYCFGTKSE